MGCRGTRCLSRGARPPCPTSAGSLGLPRASAPRCCPEPRQASPCLPGILVLGSLSGPVPRSSAHGSWQGWPGRWRGACHRGLHSKEAASPLGAPPHPWPLAVCSWAPFILRPAETEPPPEGWSDPCPGAFRNWWWRGHPHPICSPAPPHGPAEERKAGLRHGQGWRRAQA